MKRSKNKFLSKRCKKKYKKKRTYNKRKTKNIYGGDLAEYNDMDSAYTVLYRALNETDAKPNELDFIQIQKLYLTLQYAINMKGIFVIVHIKNSNLVHYEAFYSRSWNSGPAELLLEKYSKETDIENKLIDQMETYNKYRMSEKGGKRGLDTRVDIKDVMVDRCMIRQNKSMLDVHTKPGEGWYHINLYKDLITQYLSDRVDTSDINKLFILNLNDHPLIQKQILDTSFLISRDTTEYYSDSIFPHSDCWIRFRSAEYSDEMGDHFTFIQGYIDEYTSEDFDIEGNYDSKISKRINKAVFRGKLTGCNPLSDKNSRLSLFNESKETFSPGVSPVYSPADSSPGESGEGLIDIQLTGIYKNVLIKNYLYGTDIETDNEVLNASDYIEPIGSELQQYYLKADHLFVAYQYIISIDGYVSAWRLTYELLLGNIVFIKTNYTSWITEHLISEDNIHQNCYFINDLNEVGIIIRNLNSDPAKKKQISTNATVLGRKLLTKDCIYDCVKNTFDMVPSIYLSESLGYQHIY